MAPALLGGFLRAYGHEQIRLYDFNGVVRDRLQQGHIDLAVFEQQAAVDAFLAGGEGGPVQEQVRRILGALDVQPADLFCLSCALASSIGQGAEALLDTCLSLATELKRRLPGCAIVCGGPFYVSESEHISRFRRALERCPALDFAVVGEGEVPLLRIVEHLQGEPGHDLASTHPRLERRGSGLLLLRADDDFQRQAPDVHLGALRVRGTEEMFREPEEGRFTTVPPRLASIFCPPLFELRQPRRTGAQLMRDYLITCDAHPGLEDSASSRVEVLPLKFINGCLGGCAFCGYSTLDMDRWGIDAVIRTLAQLRREHQVRYFLFFNTNINPSYAQAEAFCDALIAADLDILWADSLNLRRLDEPLMDKLVRSGFIRAAIGAEAASDRQLKQFSKLGLSADLMATRLRQLHERGIWNHVQFVAGLPWETAQDVAQTVDFIRATADHSDAYSVMPFRVEPVSRITLDPARYGIELMEGTSDTPGFGTYEYRELEGGPRGNPDFAGAINRLALSRDDKRRETLETLRAYYQAIQLAKRSERYVRHGLHFELLFWLYESLGHGNKSHIVRIFESCDLERTRRPTAEDEPGPAELHPDLVRAAAALESLSSSACFGGYRLVSLACRGGVPGGRVELALADGDDQIVLRVALAESCAHPMVKVGGFAIEQHWSVPLDNLDRLKAVQELAQLLSRVSVA